MDDASPTLRSTLATAAPAALAIAVFGVLFGAAARPLIGVELTLAMSLLVFSGATQFSTLALVAAGAAAPALLLTTAILNVRHLVMGAVLRPILGASRLRRGLLAWFMLDETFGFTIVAAERMSSGPAREAVAERTLLATGICCYAAWLVGTVLGILGAGVQGLNGVAEALFPVLFVGLAALTARRLSLALRAVAAAVLTAAICFAAPDWRALAPAVTGLLVALPPDRPPSATS
ncbi:MAG TPA: AzlC family ABC transporter permease [Candidatus Limnocylindria bacterium]|jgi:predicted branched-subunit amino acid permease